ncbi:hypothetical protein VTK26DRAFT_6400 [Humicola hyalothermophila]
MEDPGRSERWGGRAVADGDLYGRFASGHPDKACSCRSLGRKAPNTNTSFQIGRPRSVPQDLAPLKIRFLWGSIVFVTVASSKNSSRSARRRCLDFPLEGEFILTCHPLTVGSSDKKKKLQTCSYTNVHLVLKCSKCHESKRRPSGQGVARSRGQAPGTIPDLSITQIWLTVLTKL